MSCHRIKVSHGTPGQDCTASLGYGVRATGLADCSAARQTPWRTGLVTGVNDDGCDIKLSAHTAPAAPEVPRIYVYTIVRQIYLFRVWPMQQRGYMQAHGSRLISYCLNRVSKVCRDLCCGARHAQTTVVAILVLERWSSLSIPFFVDPSTPWLVARAARHPSRSMRRSCGSTFSAETGPSTAPS